MRERFFYDFCLIYIVSLFIYAYLIRADPATLINLYQKLIQFGLGKR